MELDEIIAEAKKLHDSAGEIGSLSGAQDAVRTVTKLIYYLAKAQTKSRSSIDPSTGAGEV